MTIILERISPFPTASGLFKYKINNQGKNHNKMVFSKDRIGKPGKPFNCNESDTTWIKQELKNKEFTITSLSKPLL